MGEEKRTAVSVFKAAVEDKAVIANLIQLYLYDMTADLPFPIGRNGRFEYDYLDRFWQHPYLIFQGDELAGFALVIDSCLITDTDRCFFMAEFFVLKAYRGGGVGKTAFADILQRHSGKWHIGVIDKNEGANAFWEKAMAHQKTINFPKRFDGENWLVYEFVSTP